MSDNMSPAITESLTITNDAELMGPAPEKRPYATKGDVAGLFLSAYENLVENRLPRTVYTEAYVKELARLAGHVLGLDISGLSWEVDESYRCFVDRIKASGARDSPLTNEDVAYLAERTDRPPLTHCIRIKTAAEKIRDARYAAAVKAGIVPA